MVASNLWERVDAGHHQTVETVLRATRGRIANELVEWFNQVDLTYKAELRELNELNWARFGAKLDQGLAELRTELADLRADLMKWMFLYWVGTALTVIGILKL